MSCNRRKNIEWMLRKRLRDERGLTDSEADAVDTLQERMSKYKTLTAGEAAGFVAGLRA